MTTQEQISHRLYCIVSYTKQTEVETCSNITLRKSQTTDPRCVKLFQGKQPASKVTWLTSIISITEKSMIKTLSRVKHGAYLGAENR